MRMGSRSSAIRFVIGASLGLLSGILMVAALQPVAIWPLILLGLVPMILAQHLLLPLRWCWVPVSFTAFVYVLGSYSQIFLAHALWYALLAPLLVSVCVIPLALIDRVLALRYRYVFFVVQMPVMWTGLDALRQNFALSGTGGYPVYALSYQPTLIQPVSLTGISGLELLILVVNYAVALAILAVILRRTSPGTQPTHIQPAVSTTVLTVTVTAMLVVTWSITGTWLTTSVASNSGPTVRVAAVQPGAFQANLGSAPTAAQLIQIQDALGAMTRKAAAAGAQVVVWPEESLPFQPLQGPAASKAWFQDLLRTTGVTLVTGYVDPQPDGGYENRAGVFTPNGQLLGTYTKAHHAPFDNDVFPVGTSFPSFATDVSGSAATDTPKHSAGSVPVTIGMVICFDYDFPYTVRFTTLSGANMIAAPAWQFGALGRIGEEQKLIFDAVMSRVPAVSADLAWTSIIVQANGEVVNQSITSDPSGESALLVGDVQLGPRDSPYLMLGNWVGTLCVFATLLILGWGFAIEFRRRRSAVGDQA